MRENLFRGQAKNDTYRKDGDWIYSSFIMQDPKTELLSHQVELFDGSRWVAIDPETVGQYTGLTVNGTKIFEGDVGRYKQTDGAKRNGNPIICTGKVIYWAKTASYSVESKDEAGCKYFDYFPIKDFEIIGNIHDNPELLEGGMK